MKSAHLLTVAFSVIACTNSHSNTVAFKDSAPCINLPKNTTVTAPVVSNKKTLVNDTPELPFFKDVLNAKRMFW